MKLNDNNPLLPPEREGGGDLREEIVDVLRGIYDPEIPISIWELGLIYNVDIEESNAVRIRMTLTSPACPVAEMIPAQVEQRVKMVSGVSKVEVEIVWDPPWSKEMMSEAAKLQLGFL
jgi:FeS assembly SUF system protein